MKLTKTLGLWDTILFNVTAITGLRWISVAAAGGNPSMVLWLLALLLFFLPQAFAVVDLTRRLPGEGGLYLWTKTAFGDFHGFMAGWCYWTNNLVYFPNLLVYIAGISVFVGGSGYQAVGEEKLYVVIFSLVVLWSVMLFNFIGLQFGKWLHNIGGFSTWATGAVLVTIGVIAAVKFGTANPMPAASFFHGIFGLERLSFWATICFAFSGFELASVLAEEVRTPEKTIPRAITISGVVITGIYLLGTFSLLVALPASEVNIISGFLQAIDAVVTKVGLGWTSSIIALLITLGGIGGVMAWFTGAARMPFVAGVDRYLPAGFGKIHPKYGTPYVAVLIQAGIATLFIIMSFIGATVKEAYLILLDTTLLVYFIPYVYVFLAYMAVRARGKERKSSTRPSMREVAVYVVGTCGLLTTLFAMGMSVIPSAEISNVLIYELKVVGGFLMFVLTGGGIYLWEKRSR
ncbi:MAG: APC family permease [bacterium]